MAVLATEIGELVRAALEAAGLTDITPVQAAPAWGDGIAYGCEATLTVGADGIRLGVGVLENFPLSFPRVFVLSPEHRRLPHVSHAGELCVVATEGVMHDHRADSELFDEVCRRARTTLERGLLGLSRAELYDELEAYWPTTAAQVIALVAPDECPRIVSAFFRSSNGRGKRHPGPQPLVAIADSAAMLAAAFPRLASTSARTAIYVPLRPTFIDEQVHPSELLDRSRLLSLVKRHSAPDAGDLLRRIHARRDQSLAVLLSIPRPAGGRAMLGVELTRFARTTALVDASPSAVVPFRANRFDTARVQDRLGARCGEGARAARRKVLIVGCGAVGGHIASALAAAGNDLVLVDLDAFSAANTFRHVVGADGWLSSKVSALKRQIERQYPGIHADSRMSAIEDEMAVCALDLNSFASIVVAIGGQTVPLWLNDTLAEMRVLPPTIFTWLEPYGLAGHAVLVSYDRHGACLRCAFDAVSLDNRLDFAAPNQNFAVRELGCSGEFTPYADLDARETATLAARLAVEAMGNRSLQSQARFWRGDGAAFVRAGFETAARFGIEPRLGTNALEPNAQCETCKERFGGAAELSAAE